MSAEDFHTAIDAVKAEGDAILARLDKGTQGAQARLAATVATAVANADPVLVRIAAACLDDVLGAAPAATVGAVLAAAESATLAALKSLGKAVAPPDLPALKATLIACYQLRAAVVQNQLIAAAARSSSQQAQAELGQK